MCSPVKLMSLSWERCVGRELVKRTRVSVLPLCSGCHNYGSPWCCAALPGLPVSFPYAYSWPLPLPFPLLGCLSLHLPMHQWLHSDLGFKIPTTERPLLSTLHITASLLLILCYSALNQCHVLQSTVITWHIYLFIKYQLLLELLEYRLLPIRAESLFVCFSNLVYCGILKWRIVPGT